MVITSQMLVPSHNPDFAGRPPNAGRRSIKRPGAGVSDLPVPGLREGSARGMAVKRSHRYSSPNYKTASRD